MVMTQFHYEILPRFLSIIATQQVVMIKKLTSLVGIVII